MLDAQLVGELPPKKMGAKLHVLFARKVRKGFRTLSNKRCLNVAPAVKANTRMKRDSHFVCHATQEDLAPESQTQYAKIALRATILRMLA